MSYNDDTLCLYIDGKPEGKIAKKFTTRFLAGDSVMVGNSANTKNKRFFNGSVDDICIYNRVLTPAEVEELYLAPNPNRFGSIKKWLLLSALFLTGVILIVLYITNRYRRALQREKVKNELQNQLYNMEVRVMKAQMNPHFIFNSLNAIQHFILANENDKAYKYLTKFSKLVRRLLESNEANYITLADEINILERYLEIEELRFAGSFEYKITCAPELLPEKTHIPHMLIQPFVENALWHGLLHKKSDRHLAISFFPADEKSILAVVEDNGVGRSENASGVSGKKSMAIEMIRQRLRLIEKVQGIKGEVTIVDKQNNRGQKEGTRVELKIPVLKYESDHN
jgi:LytS/YehU family sensor histidine kinase